MVLSSVQSVATTLHFAPKMEKALATAHRFKTLVSPAVIRSLLWRSTVLAQGLHGAEVRNIHKAQLRPLVMIGQSLLPSTPFVALNIWAAAEVLSGPFLGETAFHSPLFASFGVVHRSLASAQGSWSEPTPSLKSALTALS